MRLFTVVFQALARDNLQVMILTAADNLSFQGMPPTQPMLHYRVSA